MNGKKISIMIPCYNEEENAFEIYKAVKNEIATNLPKYEYEIVFIDNKSKDKTREIIRAICQTDKNVKAIFNIKNFGQFNSPYYALTQCTGDCVISMCADFQDPVELIPEMVHQWEDGNKVICMVKKSSKESKLMYFARSCYYKLIKRLSDVEQIEHFTGFGLYDKSFIEILRNLKDSMPFIRGIVAEYSPDHLEIPYEQAKRRAGKTHNNFYTLYDAAMLSFTSYTKAGLRVVTFFGFFVALISLLVSLVYLIYKLTHWNSFDAGVAPVIIGLFFVGGVQLGALGFIGEYIMNMNQRLINRPLVIEEERINW
ncbi:MAG: glycosyltransferase family 2 protein [Clostridia bacterium]|nr:glycosyltransferase family 2 protein [Clostridia bacterium]